MGRVVIKRISNFSYSARALGIYLNGKKWFTISNGKTVSNQLEPGQYNIQAKIDWYNSDVLSVNVQDDEVFIEVEIEGNMLKAFSFSSGSYIKIRQVGELTIPEETVNTVRAQIDDTLQSEEKRNGDFSGSMFISYRRQDSPNVTGRIYDRLVQRYGREAVFKDVDNIPLGVDFREHLSDSVGKCKVLLAIIGDEWLGEKGESNRLLDDADFVRIEIESALERNVPIIPLLVREAKMPNKEDLPRDMQPLLFRNGMQVRPDPDFGNDMHKLFQDLDQIIK